MKTTDVKVWYKEAESLYLGFETSQYILPDSALTEATIISADSDGWGWIKVITEDGQIETVNMSQVYFIQHGDKRRVENKTEKYEDLPNYTGWRLLYSSFGGQLTSLLFFYILISGLLFMGTEGKIFAVFLGGIATLMFGGAALHGIGDYRFIKQYNSKREK